MATDFYVFIISVAIATVSSMPPAQDNQGGEEERHSCDYNMECLKNAWKSDKTQAYECDYYCKHCHGDDHYGECNLGHCHCEKDYDRHHHNADYPERDPGRYYDRQGGTYHEQGYQGQGYAYPGQGYFPHPRQGYPDYPHGGGGGYYHGHHH